MGGGGAHLAEGRGGGADQQVVQEVQPQLRLQVQRLSREHPVQAHESLHPPPPSSRALLQPRGTVCTLPPPATRLQLRLNDRWCRCRAAGHLAGVLAAVLASGVGVAHTLGLTEQWLPLHVGIHLRPGGVMLRRVSTRDLPFDTHCTQPWMPRSGPGRMLGRQTTGSLHAGKQRD